MSPNSPSLAAQAEQLVLELVHHGVGLNAETRDRCLAALTTAQAAQREQIAQRFDRLGETHLDRWTGTQVATVIREAR